jgi:membrane-associated phospholipid phosphatase
MTDHNKTEAALIRIARIISAFFSPYYIAFVAFLILFVFSYLRIMPLQYKLIVLGVVYAFTILIPQLTIYIFRKVNGYTHDDMAQRRHRYVPLFLYLISYVFCLIIMRRLNIPWYMKGIILTALLMMVLCLVLNLRWRISEHMTGAGATIGGLVAFSMLFGYNPVWWLCALILVTGVVGSARIVLGHHSLGEVLVGFAVGLACSFMVLHPFYNDLLRFLLF